MVLRRASTIGLSLLTVVTMTGRTGGDRTTPDEALGAEFVVAEGMVDVSYPAIGLDHTSGVVLDVSIAVLESEEIVEVYPISPCAIGESPR